MKREKNLNQISLFRLKKISKITFKDAKINFSDGWLYKFLKRNNFSYRKITGRSFVNEKQLDLTVSEFFPQLQSKLNLNQDLELWTNIGETCVTLDIFSGKTIDETGNK